MEEQKNSQTSGQPIGSILADLKIRTMSDDLKGAPNSPAPLAGQTSMSAAPKAPPPPNIPAQIPPRPSPPPARVIPEPPLHLPGETLVIDSQPSFAATKLPPLPTPQTQIPPIAPKPVPAVPPAPPPDQFASRPISSAKKPIFKLVVIFGVLLLAVGLAAGAYFFWPSEQPKPVCQEGQITTACQCGADIKETGFCCQNNWLEKDCSVTKPPIALISAINQQLPINIKDATLNKVIADIKTNLEGSTEEKARLVVLKTGVSPATYATLDETVALFGLKIDSLIKNNTSDFNLLAYVNPAVASTSTSTATVGSGNASSSPETEKEIRLLLVLKQNHPSLILPAMTGWETTMLEDIKPMILGSPGPSMTSEFQSSSYNNGSFRYKKLSPITTALAINYTVKDNILIIGTSKNSVFYAWDAVNNTR